ncbi:hypothetical protein HPB52_018262 [Rhipicephalus sanguineus]|uniref:Uncharacterized protein n=1 Tax=Rhipicephalus sanguineus TaxID=34632 RepID=A0A9D4TBC5_RHISA|nr:hypothetical protein HPB52_018262 [Rhipicephalus sanguineus]
MDWTTFATVAQVAVERVDSDSDEEEFDDIVAMLAVKLGAQPSGKHERGGNHVAGPATAGAYQSGLLSKERW